MVSFKRASIQVKLLALIRTFLRRMSEEQVQAPRGKTTSAWSEY